MALQSASSKSRTKTSSKKMTPSIEQKDGDTAVLVPSQVISNKIVGACAPGKRKRAPSSLPSPPSSRSSDNEKTESTRNNSPSRYSSEASEVVKVPRPRLRFIYDSPPSSQDNEKIQPTPRLRLVSPSIENRIAHLIGSLTQLALPNEEVGSEAYTQVELTKRMMDNLIVSLEHLRENLERWNLNKTVPKIVTHSQEQDTRGKSEEEPLGSHAAPSPTFSTTINESDDNDSDSSSNVQFFLDSSPNLSFCTTPKSQIRANRSRAPSPSSSYHPRSTYFSPSSDSVPSSSPTKTPDGHSCEN